MHTLCVVGAFLGLALAGVGAQDGLDKGEKVLASQAPSSAPAETPTPVASEFSTVGPTSASISGSDSFTASTYTGSGTTTFTNDFPDCDVAEPSWVGDGWCDDELGNYNTQACGWDGGDCCECDCIANGFEGICGVNAPYSCKDPTSSCRNPCDSLPCGVHGICTNHYGYPICRCEDGWERIVVDGGYECVSIACADVDCGENASCVPGNDGDYNCYCDEGYENAGVSSAGPCVPTEICAGYPCGDDAVCASEDGVPYCTCYEGWENTGTGDEVVCTIIDYCAQVTCPENSYCDAVDTTVYCYCDEGYENTGPSAGDSISDQYLYGGGVTCTPIGGPDPTCSNGVVGYEAANSKGSACCPLGCTKCGGYGCGSVGSAAGLGSTDCCVNGVLNNQDLCSVTGAAPCVIEPEVIPGQTCSNGIAGIEGTNGSSTVCCPLGCTKCGGSGCGSVGSAAGLSNADCCIGGIVSHQGLCSDTGVAPCKL